MWHTTAQEWVAIRIGGRGWQRASQLVAPDTDHPGDGHPGSTVVSSFSWDCVVRVSMTEAAARPARAAASRLAPAACHSFSAALHGSTAHMDLDYAGLAYVPAVVLSNS